MRLTRGFWIVGSTSSIVATMLGIVFICLALFGESWIELHVSMPRNVGNVDVIGLNTTKSVYIGWFMYRVRGLWFECAFPPRGSILNNYSSICSSLTYFHWIYARDSKAKFLLLLRVVQPALGCSALFLLVPTLGIIIQLLIVVWRRPKALKPRTAQYTVVIGGAILWGCGYLTLICVLLHYEILSEESYITDPRLFTARSAWPEEVRSKTTHITGDALIWAYLAWMIIFFGSFGFLAIGGLQPPPNISRRISKLPQSPLSLVSLQRYNSKT